MDFIKSIKSEFEFKGWDVSLLLCLKYDDREQDTTFLAHKLEFLSKYFYIDNQRFLIEIKPNISDDYPAILRQIKNNNRVQGEKFLIYDKFSAKGASLEQVKQIFSSSGIYVLSFADILGHEVL